MALYADGSGQYQSEYDALWQSLVPKSGRAATLQGELVRLIGRLASEYCRNGNMNWSDDFNGMAKCLEAELRHHFDEPSDQQAIQVYLYQIIKNGETGICYYLDGEDIYDKITDYVVMFCRQNKSAVLNHYLETYHYSY